MVYQKSVVNTVNWFADQLQVTPESRVLGLTTFCFDISVLEVFLPLTRGATLVLAETTTQKDPFTLADLITDKKITVVQATPTTYEMLLASGWGGDMSIDFLVGGEAFRSTILPLTQNCRSMRNVYGPTETTIWSSSYTITKTFVRNAKKTGSTVNIPIGQPISETVFYVVDPDANPPVSVADGEEGELWIGKACQ